MKELTVRKKIRLEGYDYSQSGAYFITICVKDGHSILWERNAGEISVGAISNRPQTSQPILSETGKIVDMTLFELNENIAIDKYVIMPNHIHMIVRIENSERLDNGGRTEFAPTISSIIIFYKSRVTEYML